MTTWPQLLARIDISGLRPPMRFVYRDAHVRVEWKVPHRDTGVEDWVFSVWLWVGPIAFDCPATYVRLEKLLESVLGHEVREQFKVDGHRLFEDAHA